MHLLSGCIEEGWDKLDPDFEQNPPHPTPRRPIDTEIMFNLLLRRVGYGQCRFSFWFVQLPLEALSDFFEDVLAFSSSPEPIRSQSRPTFVVSSGRTTRTVLTRFYLQSFLLSFHNFSDDVISNVVEFKY